MPPVRPHSTATDKSSSWDGPGNERKFRPTSAEAMRNFYAWTKAGMDAGNPKKSDGKFPHHNVDDNGVPRAANISGVNNALSRLPQADIPDADRAGVERHLRRHRRDAGLERDAGGIIDDGYADPDGLFEEALQREIGPGGLEGRVGPIEVQAAASDDDDGKRISGYASVFNTPARIMGFFTDWEEEVAPGAFTKTLRESKRILSAFNHDLGRLLGTTDSKTARFSEDKTGLHYSVDVDERDPLALSVWSQVDARKVNGASIWFRVLKHLITLPAEDSDDLPRRRIIEVQLYEGGPVVRPAFTQTTATTRDSIALDGALRALDAPDEMRASLAVDALYDPERFEHRLRELLAERPELREAVCSCQTTEVSPDRADESRGGGSEEEPSGNGHSSEVERRQRVARGFAARTGLPMTKEAT